MALPASFSNNTSPTGVQLDADLAALAAMGIWNTTATGTNVVALTTTANQPAVSAYVDRQRFQFIWPNNTTAAVTVAINSLSALPLYLIGGTQAASGDGASGTPCEIIYLAALNSGGGGFQIYSASPSSAVAPSQLAQCRGLTITNNSSTPSTKIDITALAAVMVTTGGSPKLATTVSVTIDLTTVGANGMDIGSRPTSGWVYNYLISNGSGTAGLASTSSPSAAAPTMPSGYTYAAYVGAMYCDASQNLTRAKQVGKIANYQPTAATNTLIMPTIASGSAGSYSVTSPTLSAITVAGNTAGFVPLTAGSIFVTAANRWKGGAVSSVLVAPSTAWGGSNNGPQGSGGQTYPIYLPATELQQTAELVLAAATIAWAANAAGAAISCGGWSDYYSCG